MLTRWFDRSGIGQILAPDPEAAPVSEDDESRSVVWQFLAPDDNFAPPRAPPKEIFPPSFTNGDSSHGLPMERGSSTSSFPQTPQTPAVAATPNGTQSDGADLNERVLSACRDTSMFMRSPAMERKTNDKFLRFCASTKKLADKLLKKMRSMVVAENFKDAYLLRVRATKMGESAPDGYTSLMVAAYANHLDAAKLILELAEDYAFQTGDKTTYADLHLDRDMLGMTALHIAGERGHLEMVQFLLPLYQFPEAPTTSLASSSIPENSERHVPLVDLGGHTAFGRAVTSPNPKAKRNQRAMQKTLYTANDLSIFGKAKPIGERMGSVPSLGLEYGTADMPGLRGYMEDAMSVETWVPSVDSSSSEVVLFSVCDGHGDNGKMSDFVASNAKAVLDECLVACEPKNILPSHEYWTTVWEAVSFRLDRKLREAHLTEGGSTGVFCLVTDKEIVVANVGDCRCILASVQTDPPETPTTDSSPPELVQEEAAGESSEAPSKEEETTTESTGGSKVVVKALSEDHKPNLPGEADRVRNAGFDVKSITIKEEDGSETVIHKVAKSDRDQLAVSRAFGDFDYKANKTLGEAEQAVVPLADVTVHTRNQSNDLYLVLACDGIWDVMDNEAVIDLVRKQSAAKAATSGDSLLPDVADVLLQECLGKESRDNLSAILVSLGPAESTINNSNETVDSDMPPKTLDFGTPTN